MPGSSPGDLPPRPRGPAAWVLHRAGEVSGEATDGHSTSQRQVELGSVTKVLTSELLDALERAGVVSADDPVEAWSAAPAGTGVTLRLLASHRSGLPRLPPGVRLLSRDPYRDLTVDALDAAVARLDRYLDHPPGSREVYSNFGYAVLGRALARAAGAATWYEAVVRHVLDPLGLPPLTWRPDPERRLVGRGRTGRVRQPWTMTGAIAPAGGLWGTVEEVAAAAERLLPVDGSRPPTAAWQRSGDAVWHNGATRDSAMFVGRRVSTGALAVVHTMRWGPSRTDAFAVDLLR